MRNDSVIAHLTANSSLACQKLCQGNHQCNFFNWNSKSKNCFLRPIMTNGAASIRRNATLALVGARHCSDVRFIWPEHYQLKLAAVPSPTTIQAAPRNEVLTTATVVQVVKQDSLISYSTTPESAFVESTAETYHEIARSRYFRFILFYI